MRGRGEPAGPRIERRALDGWICLDKPLGLTSTQAVGRLRFLLKALKAGHAGTLDPLATGILPIAFGEATKTIPIVQDGEKEYAFTVKWGEETATDDSEGAVTLRSDSRPSTGEIEAVLPRFTGLIDQRPPDFSAIKVDGERAYDLARGGQAVELAERKILVRSLTLTGEEPGLAHFSARCGKGAYVRSLARDIGRALGCHGHVVALRRTRVGPFSLENSSADAVESAEAAERALKPLSAGLTELPRIAIDRDGAAVLRCGQRLLLRGDAPGEGETAYVTCLGEPVAIGWVEGGHFVSSRVINASGRA